GGGPMTGIRDSGFGIREWVHLRASRYGGQPSQRSACQPKLVQRSGERRLGFGTRSGFGLPMAVAVLATTLVGSACGYSLAGRGSFLPAYIKTIGRPLLANRTAVFNLETLLTEKVRREFIGRGRYTVLPQATDVDATLLGEISSVTVTPVSFSPTQLASRYTITMVAKIELHDNRNN